MIGLTAQIHWQCTNVTAYAAPIMTRTLDSDQLGEKGQQRFGELCVSAGLIPNKATWDRKGWDFVVDWRHDRTRVAFDERPTLPSCLVQVKTVWAGAKAVKAPLLALEHIAKDLKPAFIYVLSVVDDEEYGPDAFLAHLDDELLTLILTSLRKARAANKSSLSKDELRLPLNTWFKQIPQTGKALRQSLEESIGPSMGAYAQAKQRKLKELGFEAGHVELKLSIEAENRQAFLDGFLGLQPLKFIGASAVETRFGIPIPVPDLIPPDGEIHVQPKPFNHCKLIIRDGPAGDPIVFRGDMYGPPKDLLAPDELQILIRTRLFDLRFSATGIKPPAMVKMKLTMGLNGEKIRKARLPASDWSAFYNFLSLATDHPVSVEMTVGKGKTGPLSGTLSMDLDGTPAENWPLAASVCVAAERVLRVTGWSGTKLVIEDIGNAGEKLEVLRGLLDEPSSLNPLSFVSTKMPGLRDGDAYDVLYVDGFELGPHSVVYAVKAEMIATVRQDDVEWTSRGLTLTKLERVKTQKRALEQFLERAKRETGIQIVVANDGFIPAHAKSG